VPKEQEVGVVYQFGAEGLEGTLKIDSAEALKALAHPLRSSLLKHLSAPRSIKELAGDLDVPVARLYHHVKLLQEHGLIVVADERRVGSNVERLYRVAAARIEVAGTLARDWLAATRDTATMLSEAHARFTPAIDAATKAGMEDGHERGDGLLEPWFLEAIGHLSGDQARRLVTALRAAVRELRDEVDGGPADGPRFGLQLVFTRFPEGKESRWAESHSVTTDT
jgi:DNA-binding transcriptional ArsR family regulator